MRIIKCPTFAFSQRSAYMAHASSGLRVCHYSQHLVRRKASAIVAVRCGHGRSATQLVFSGHWNRPEHRCFSAALPQCSETTSRQSITSTSQIVTLPLIPELFNSNFLDALIPPTESVLGSHSSQNDVRGPVSPMIEALKANANHILTTNNSPTYKSTLSPTLDAFQFLRQGCDAHSLSDYLEKAWHEDPLLTLRLIWNLRSIHDGKNDKELFYQAYGWLYENHPRTAIENLRFLVDPVCSVAKDLDPSASHGYWKDLLNIVALAVNNELRPLRAQTGFLNKPRPQRLHWRERLARKQQRRVRRGAGVRTEWKMQQQKQQEESRKLRVATNKGFHSTLVAKLSDKRFRALYIAVARLFADKLKADLGVLQLLEQCSQGKERQALLRQLSLAGKWAPTPGHSHDRSTNLATTIAVLVLRDLSVLPRPKLSAPLDTTDISTADSHIVRSFYQKWILRPLRQVLQCPEPLMAANRWDEIMYTRVPAVCMKRNKLHFFEHDPERFEKYLVDVADGKKTISGATLLPHELLGEVTKLSAKSEYDPTQKGRLSKVHIQQRVAETQLRTIEQQWKVMVDRLRQHGPLENSVAICDVSGSMGDLSWYHPRFVQPIHPAMALSLVIAQIAKPPFTNVLITFSQQPEFIELNPADSLHQTCQKIAGANWGMNTDLNAVFLNLLLPLAIKHHLKQEDMIKRLFIFSDMQFDESLPKQTIRKSRFNLTSGETVVEQQSTIWETNHDVIETAFEEAGYELPEIVYWNLAGEYSTAPVTHDKKGVSLMSGFSPSMMKVFLGEDENESVEPEETKNAGAKKRSKRLTPVEVMRKVLSRKSYEGLVVLD